VKVLTIAHNAVAHSNRGRVDALAALPDLDVDLLTPRWWFEEGRRVVVPHAAQWRVGRTLATGNGTRHAYLSGLFDAVRTLKPDVIDLFEEPFSVVALQTLIARDLFAPQAALVFYSAVNVDRRWRLPYRAIEHLLLRRADGAHVPNADVRPILRRKGMLQAPIDVVPLGVDPERFANASPMDLDSTPRPRVGFLGRLEPVKGLSTLVDASRLLRSEASLVVAGDGPDRQALDERVRWLGAIEHADVPAFLKSLDVLVLPSVTILPLHREQFGRVLVEAMAAGVPVIGSTSGAIPDVIGDAGIVVPERDASALAQAIDQLLGDPSLRRTLVERGRKRVEAHFTWSVVAKQTCALFRSAIVHRQRAGRRLEEVRA